MATIDLIMPKMGESIMEATILKWIKQEGDSVSEDETILEIATDKVDSEIPSPANGVMGKILYQSDDVVEVGKVIAYIHTETTAAEHIGSHSVPPITKEIPPDTIEAGVSSPDMEEFLAPDEVKKFEAARPSQAVRFYSPLVRNIAAKENILIEELDRISGTGMNGRVTKNDLLTYVKNRSSFSSPANAKPVVPKEVPTTMLRKETVTESPIEIADTNEQSPLVEPPKENVEIIEMDRMRRLIADHMIHSKKTSAHVTSFVEADVTNLVEWRNKVKDEFYQKHYQKITLTPIFIEAVIKAIQDFPRINASVEENKIIIKHDVHIGMATALSNGNLIVPVIRNADHYNMVGLAKTVNDLAYRARENKLLPQDIQGGTFTVTNVGTFGNVMGTPIINQPEVAILATGAIRKKPTVIETKYGWLSRRFIFKKSCRLFRRIQY
jgi:2-oxoglutarate dehydrogenase E2 component (dihydrolipoamide succinyltransferase)